MRTQVRLSAAEQEPESHPKNKTFIESWVNCLLLHFKRDDPVEYYSAIKQEVSIHLAPWMDLENLMLNERSQTQGRMV